jgi:transposase
VAIDPKHLPDDPKLLQQMVLDLMAQLDREFTERNKIETLLRELLDAKRNRKSEQLSEDQLALFAALWEARQKEREEAAAANDDDRNATPGASDRAAKKKSGGGRQPLPRHLKRERIVRDVEDGEKHCAQCAQDLRLIGEETSERYEYVPASLVVVEEACLKYACSCTIKTAGKPSQPIEKSNAGASLLAQVIVSKFADHLPLHRQEKIFERHGAEISRKSMCGWLAQCADLLNPLYGSLKEVLFESKVIGTDDTGVKVLLRRQRTSGRHLRLHSNPGTGRTGEIPRRIWRLLTGGCLRRIRRSFQGPGARSSRGRVLGSCPKILPQSAGVGSGAYGAGPAADSAVIYGGGSCAGAGRRRTPFPAPTRIATHSG